MPREQTDQVLAPQTAAFHVRASDHEEVAFRHVHATTVATHHPEAEDGPSGELTPKPLSSPALGRTTPTHTVGTRDSELKIDEIKTTQSCSW